METLKCNHHVNMLTGYCTKCKLKIFRPQTETDRNVLWVQEYLNTKAVNPGKEE